MSGAATQGNMFGVLRRQSQRKVHVRGEFRRFDSAPQRMVNCPPFGTSAMNIIGLGTYRLRRKLRVMSDEGLWWLFLHHRPECSREFWEELENRKAAGILSKDAH